MRLGDARAKVGIEVIPTGALAVDLALGVGGVPRGRVVEIFGPESSGKTTLMLHVIANAQKAGGLAAFIDAEHALDPAYAKKLGVNLDDLLVSQPDSGEEALTICETLARSNALDVIVIDSVAALVPKAELEGEMGMATMGMQARLMSQALRKLTAILAKSKTTCIFTNQLREKVGVMFGNPGNHARRQGAQILRQRPHRHPPQATRSRTPPATPSATPSRSRLSRTRSRRRSPRPSSTSSTTTASTRKAASWTWASTHGVVDKKGAWLQFEGELIGQGKEAARQALAEKPELAQKIVAAIMAKRNGSPVVATP